MDSHIKSESGWSMPDSTQLMQLDSINGPFDPVVHQGQRVLGRESRKEGGLTQ